MVNSKKYNFGLSVLRTFLCFSVVMDHFYIQSESEALYMRPLLFSGQIAVPVFMLMSFYLSQKVIMSGSREVMKKRLWRILLPQIVWAVIYWCVLWAAQKITHAGSAFGVSALCWQMLTGHSPYLNTSMWFQTDLLLLTILFFILCHFTGRRTFHIVSAILLGRYCSHP